MRSGPSRSETRSLLALCALAAVAIELACKDPREAAAVAVGRAAVYVAAMLGVRRLLAGYPMDSLARSWPAVAIGLAALFVPFALEGLVRAFSPNGWPFEAVMLSAVRNLTLALVCGGRVPLLGNLAAGVSVFGFLIAFSIAEESKPLAWLFAAYLVAGCHWLAQRYWSGFDDRQTKAGAASIRWATAAIGAAVLALFVGAYVGPRRVIYALWQVAPSSGGDRRYDRHARGGAGDEGTDTVDSNNAKSDGGQGDVYIESDRRTFYDAITENLGEPKPPKDRNRAVALAPSQIVKDSKIASNSSSGRHFDVYRETARPRERPADAPASSLFVVAGPAPAHIAMASYATFDGERWHEEGIASEMRSLALGWFRWLNIVHYVNTATAPTPAYFGGSHSHAVKVGLFKGRELPLPAHAESFRVGLVDRPEFFAFLQTNLLGLSDPTERMPEGELVETSSRSLRESALAAVSFSATAYGPAGFRQFPEASPADGDMAAAAIRASRSWTAGLPRGWRQIRAVADRLRSEYVLDPSYRNRDGDAVVDFLERSRRGPSYMFATVAACVLRSLDYPCRMVGGYYVDPAKYDAWTRSTPVESHDLHFWVEVTLPDGNSVVLEPTPGYKLTQYQPTWSEAAYAALLQSLLWLRAHPATSAFAVLGVLLAVRFRRRLGSGVAYAIWRFAARGSWRRKVEATVALVERRAWWLDRSRRRGVTWRRWSKPWTTHADDGRGRALENLLQLAELHWYGPRNAHPAPAVVNATCSEVARLWTLRALQEPFRPRTAARNAAR